MFASEKLPLRTFNERTLGFRKIDEEGGGGLRPAEQQKENRCLSFFLPLNQQLIPHLGLLSFAGSGFLTRHF